jgi:hypothetical protein
MTQKSKFKQQRWMILLIQMLQENLCTLWYVLVSIISVGLVMSCYHVYFDADVTMCYIGFGST